MALEQIPIPFKYHLRRVPISSWIRCSPLPQHKRRSANTLHILTHQLLTSIHLLCHLADNTPKKKKIEHTRRANCIFIHRDQNQRVTKNAEQTLYSLLYKTKSEKENQTKKRVLLAYRYLKRFGTQCELMREGNWESN